MQLVLDREELQLAADLVEDALFACQRDGAAPGKAEALEALLDGIVSRRLEFGCDELDALREVLEAAWAQDRTRPHLALLRDKVAEVCAML